MNDIYVYKHESIKPLPLLSSLLKTYRDNNAEIPLHNYVIHNDLYGTGSTELVTIKFVRVAKGYGLNIQVTITQNHGQWIDPEVYLQIRVPNSLFVYDDINVYVNQVKFKQTNEYIYYECEILQRIKRNRISNFPFNPFKVLKNIDLNLFRLCIKKTI